MLTILYRSLIPFCLAGAVLILLAPAPGLADDLDTSREQLADIEQRLEQTLADLARKKSIEGDVLNDLSQVDRKLAAKRRRVAREKSKLSEINRAIAAEKQQLAEHKSDVDRLQVQVQQRLVALYKSEESGVLKTLFSAQNISQLLEDYDFLGRIVAHDRQLLDDFRSRVQLRQESLSRMASAREKQQTVTRTLKKEEDDLQRTVRLKKRYLAAVRNDRDALNRMAADLKARAERLSSLVDDLEAGTKGGRTGDVSLFALQKGLLQWPVSGKVKSAFGTQKHAELGTLLENHGIEILTEPETGVKAVWDGRIAFAKRFKGFGNLIIIDHDGGYYTLYAQVQKMTKNTGDQVGKGDIIAFSGFEGADHVYFEVRKGRTPIDPLLWIEKR